MRYRKVEDDEELQPRDESINTIMPWWSPMILGPSLPTTPRGWREACPLVGEMLFRRPLDKLKPGEFPGWAGGDPLDLDDFPAL